MDEKLLSIIVPMYNSKKYIEKCLDSLILRHGFMKEIEIIVVNDGSTDGCERIVEKYVCRYPGSIRLINQRNGGHGAAVNTGIRNCTGQYFRILDADDWFITEQFEEYVRILQKIQVSDMVVCGFQTYNIQTQKENIISAEIENPIQYFTMEKVVSDWKKFKTIFSLHGIAYCTEFYRKNAIELPEKVFYDDAIFFTVAASQARKICALNQVVYVYRIGDVNQSVSAANRVCRIEQIEKVIRIICGTVNENRTQAGQEYWNYKTCSVLADYFVTTFLRYEDRTIGRRRAIKYMKDVAQVAPSIARKVRIKYIILYIMSVLGLKESHFEKVLAMRNRL